MGGFFVFSLIYCWRLYVDCRRLRRGRFRHRLAQSFAFFPPGADCILIGAFAGFSAAGGVVNITLSNWARDKGYGMGRSSATSPPLLVGRKEPRALGLLLSAAGRTW